MFVKYIAN